MRSLYQLPVEKDVAIKMEASVAYKRREIRAGMLVVALVRLDYHI